MLKEPIINGHIVKIYKHYIRICDNIKYQSFAIEQINNLKPSKIIDFNNQIQTKNFILNYNVNGFNIFKNNKNYITIINYIKTINDLKFQINIELNDDDYIYGLGERTGFLNKRNYQYISWNSDIPEPHSDDFESLYQSVNFFIVHSKNRTFGIYLDNTYKSYFNFGKTNKNIISLGSVNGSLNYYIILGENLKDIVKHFTALTGRTPLPQLWTLGHQQSRWSYKNTTEIETIMDKYREYNIPCDAIYLDIDYMDNYKVFTVDNNKFPNLKTSIKKYNENGFKLIPIIDPGVKVEEGYNIYDIGVKNNYFAKYHNQDYINAVWPGDSVFPNFLNKDCYSWWKDNYIFLQDQGFSGVWNDMNEPASFKGPIPLDVEFSNQKRTIYHQEIHNIYGHLMAKSAYESFYKTGKRPFIITRACFAGSNKYSVFWTGDNHSSWSHLEMMIPQLCNMSLSGQVICGVDIGGFNGNTTKELLARWIEIGCLTPFSRNHSASGTDYQEPWQFDNELLQIYCKFINLRYTLLPYFYDLLYKHTLDGQPIFTPLVYYYEQDENTFNINDEFMIGENLLCAPIIKIATTKRIVYLPKGNWYNYWTRQKIKGGKYFIENATLDQLPLYVKENTIIPTFSVYSHVQKFYNELTLNIYGTKGKYTHYQDDYESFDYQKGTYNLYSFIYNKELSIKMLREKYPKYKNIIIKTK